MPGVLVQPEHCSVLFPIVGNCFPIWIKRHTFNGTALYCSSIKG